MAMIYQKLQDIYNELDFRRYDDLNDYEKGMKDILNLIDPSHSGNDQEEMYFNIMREIQESNKGNNMNNYQKGKEKARQMAVNWQIFISENNLTYSELVVMQDVLHKQGKYYGLLKEFKENGIL